MISEFHTLGSHPTIPEVVNYYLRSDILPEIFRVTQVRDVTFIYRESGSKDEHIPLQPKDITELENFLRQFFTQHEGQLEPYPWFTMSWESAAYENPNSGEFGYDERRIIGWDSIIELDYGWRQSFGELYSGIQVLDDFGIHYRSKFSGHRSLHFILPAEAMPESFRERPDREIWSDTINKVGEFVITRSNYLRNWQKMGTDGVYSTPYTVHRFVGLVAIPLMPTDYLQFRPWMATVHLAAPVPNWWDVPTQAGENFQKLLDYIEPDRRVFDLQTSATKERLNTQEIGYVPGALNRSKAVAHSSDKSLAELHDGDVQARRRAAWTSMIQGTDAIGELLKAMNDEDEVVRWFALEAIRANIDDGYEDGFTLSRRRALLFADVNHVDDEHLVSAAEKLITDEDEYIRQAALDLLSESGKRGIVRLLQLTTKDNAGRLTQEALWTLRDWVEVQGEAGIETLMQFVYSNDTELRHAALLVMGKIARLAAPRLIELLSDVDENIRINALCTLLETGEGAAPFLQTAVESKQEPACILAQRALDGLKRLRVNEGLRTLLPSLNIVRLIAMEEALALPLLGQQLGSADKKTRFVAAKALSYIGQAAVPIFIDSLNSSDTNLRRRACEALRDISPPEARDALKNALTDTDVKVRQNAVRALIRIGNPDDLEAIRPLLSDASKAVRRIVREALNVKHDA